jgi:Na+-driven multidrug efflux pump
MIDLLLSLSTWAGCFVAMSFAAVVGLVVYFVSYKLISMYQSDELKDPTSSLFRVVGLLVSLMLSLAFSEVITEVRVIPQLNAKPLRSQTPSRI